MQYVILVFGFFLLGVGAVALIKPNTIFGYLGRQKESLGVHVMAVVVRAVLGAALLVYAAESGFPATLEVLGWIALVAAIALAVMGRSNFRKLMNWAMGFVATFGRLAGGVAMLFGGFLVYAVL